MRSPTRSPGGTRTARSVAVRRGGPVALKPAQSAARRERPQAIPALFPSARSLDRGGCRFGLAVVGAALQLSVFPATAVHEDQREEGLDKNAIVM